MELSTAAQKLIQKYQESLLLSQPKEGEPTIHVDEIASKVAHFYEKIRGVVDWKEEHLIRRGAIERALKRRMLSELAGLRLIPDLKADAIAEPFVTELIRGGHFPNGKIPQRKIGDVQRALEKYISVLERSPQAKNNSLKNKVQFYNWILEIAACEIEEILDPPLKENALIEFMTDLMAERIRVDSGAVITEEEKGVQTYIAVHRALFHLDAPIITYHLLKYYYPEWATQNIFLVWENVEKDLSHPLSSKFLKVCEKHDTLYLLLGDVLEMLSGSPSEIPEKISEPRFLQGLVRKAYDQRLKTLKSRLFRMAVYSTLSIFISSAFALFVIEVPLAKLFYGKFSLLAITVDILVPTLLMFLLVALARPPEKNNLERVLAEIIKIVYQREEKDVYEIKVRKKRNFLIGFVVSFLYILGSFLSLGLIVGIFHLARIPPTSIIIDTFNVAVVVFAGFIIRRRARELTVEEERANFLELLFDTLSVPVAKIGKKLSAKWREYNIVSVFFMALIDLPFQTFIEFVESWSLFLKEKKEEIR